MGSIEDFLNKIKTTRLGKDVRQSIHDAIQQCYYDGKAGSVDLFARQRIDNLAKLKEGSTTGDAELQDIRVGADGKIYENAGQAVREQVGELKGDLDKLATLGKTYWKDGANRLNPSLDTFTIGFLNPDNGGIVNNDGFKTSDYIDISDGVGKNVVFSFYYDVGNVVKPKNLRYCFFNSEKKYISGSSGAKYVIIPTNAHYIRCSFDNDAMTSIKFYMVCVQDNTSVPKEWIPYTGMSESGTLLKESAIPDNIMRKEKVVNITVGIDKDFSTIKEAVKSITNSENVEYNILIDDGTYTEYAITLPNNVNLIGVSGNREKCIIKGELPDTASANDITINSTINLLDSNRLENLTITAKNLRYPIHSESGGRHTDWVQILNNCYIEHLGNTAPANTWTSWHAWGEGSSSGAYAEFNNCVFKGGLESWYVHEPTAMPTIPKPYHHVLNNCNIINTSISTTPSWLSSAKIDNTTDKGVISTIDFNNCNFGNGKIAINGRYDINVNVHGSNNVAIRCDNKYPNTDFTTKKTYVGTESITKGTVLKYGDGINLVLKADANTPNYMIAGICVEDCEPNSIVKLIKGTYYAYGGKSGRPVYCDENGQLATSGTVQIGTCYGEFSLIN